MSGVLGDLGLGGNYDPTANSGGGSSLGIFSNAGTDVSALGSATGVLGGLIQSQANTKADQEVAQAYKQEANLYTQASTIAQAGVKIEGASGQLQTGALERAIAQTEGTAAAAEGRGNIGENGVVGTGFGSTADILRESQRQGSLALGQLNLQTQLNENQFSEMSLGYQAQAQAATAAAQQAQQSAKASSSGGFLGVLGGIAGIVSKFL